MAILNFGSLCIDNVYRVPHFVRPGETLPSTDYQVFAGGKGFNQSLAIARAGTPVVHAGAYGAGGEWLVDMLRADNVDVAHLHRAGVPTGHAVIQVAEDGGNAIVLFPGANRAITREHIDSTLAGFGAGDILLLQNEISHPGYLIEQGAARGLRIVMNPAPMDTVVKALPLHLLHMLVVNEVEAEDLTGKQYVDEMVQVLGERYPDTISVVTLGAGGAVWLSPAECFHVPAHKVDVVDTTGAGDTFTGYLLASLEQGMAPEAAMRRATAAAALCVSRAGAADSVPRAGEVTVASHAR